EARRQHLERQCRGDELADLAEAFEQKLGQLLRQRIGLRQLFVGLGADRDMTGGQAAVLPLRLPEQLAKARQFVRRQYVGNDLDHRRSLSRWLFSIAWRPAIAQVAARTI